VEQGEVKRWKKKLKIDVILRLLLSESIDLEELNKQDVTMRTASIGCGCTESDSGLF
jgi:hypothetical protein